AEQSRAEQSRAEKFALVGRRGPCPALLQLENLTHLSTSAFLKTSSAGRSPRPRRHVGLGRTDRDPPLRPRATEQTGETGDGCSQLGLDAAAADAEQSRAEQSREFFLVGRRGPCPALLQLENLTHLS